MEVISFMLRENFSKGTQKFTTQVKQDGAAKGMAMAEEGLWISDLRLRQTSPIPEQTAKQPENV